MMQTLGYDVKLFKRNKSGHSEEVDLSLVIVRPCKEIKKEMKRLKKMKKEETAN